MDKIGFVDFIFTRNSIEMTFIDIKLESMKWMVKIETPLHPKNSDRTPVLCPFKYVKLSYKEKIIENSV